MLELAIEAIVLSKEDIGEQDSRVFLYVKNIGKVAAKITSSRKIISKLAAHTEPGNFIHGRIVSKETNIEDGGFQLADALLVDSGRKLKSDSKMLQSAITILELIAQSIPNGIYDNEIWDFLAAVQRAENPATLAAALKILGFDPTFSYCEICQRSRPEFFFAKENFFVCRNCKPKSKSREIKLYAF